MSEEKNSSEVRAVQFTGENRGKSAEGIPRGHTDSNIDFDAEMKDEELISNLHLIQTLSVEQEITEEEYSQYINGHRDKATEEIISQLKGASKKLIAEHLPMIVALRYVFLERYNESKQGQKSLN